MRKKMYLAHLAHKYGYRVNNRRFLHSVKLLQKEHALTVQERGVILGDDKKRPKIVLIHDPVAIAIHFLRKRKSLERPVKKRIPASLNYPTCGYAGLCSSKKWVQSQGRFVCSLEGTCNQQKVNE